MADNNKGNQGFASMDPEKQKSIAREGGESRGQSEDLGNFADIEMEGELGGQAGDGLGNFGNPGQHEEAGEAAQRSGDAHELTEEDRSQGGQNAQRSGNAHELTDEERSRGGEADGSN